MRQKEGDDRVDFHQLLLLVGEHRVFLELGLDSLGELLPVETADERLEL